MPPNNYTADPKVTCIRDSSQRMLYAAPLSRWALYRSEVTLWIFPSAAPVAALIAIPHPAPAQELRLKEPSVMMFVAIVTWATVR